jgi:type IV pilus assembly protein PilN
MRLDINLATQPYEDARRFWLRWGPAVAGMGILTLVILSMSVTGWFAARRDRATIARMKDQIEDRDLMRQHAEEFLNRPENRSTRDESQLLNQLIERKSFSWTRVLEDMEKVMPARVHLVSINPELDDENQLALKMVVAGDSRDKAIDLARRMEESRRFAQTSITAETHGQNQGGDTETFDITAIYIPETAPPPTPEPATTKTSKAEISKETMP